MPIGTALAIGLALGTAGAQAASSIYGTKKAAGVNEKALSAQERDSMRQVELQKAEQAARQKAYDEAVTTDRQRWSEYMDANRPTWALSSKVLGSLYDMAGAGDGSPISVPPPSPAALGAAPPMAGQSLPAMAGRGRPVAPGGVPSSIPMPMGGGQPAASLLKDLMTFASLTGHPSASAAL